VSFENRFISPDLSIGHTTVEPRLGVRLYIKSVFLSLIMTVAAGESWEVVGLRAQGIGEPKDTYLVLAVAIATSGTTSHLDGIDKWIVVDDDEEEENERGSLYETLGERSVD
jgi:hypothetical protein